MKSNLNYLNSFSLAGSLFLGLVLSPPVMAADTTPSLLSIANVERIDIPTPAYQRYLDVKRETKRLCLG